MEQSITVTDVNMEDIDTLWGGVKDRLQAAVDRNQGEFTLEDIRNELILGTMTLWIAYNKAGAIKACAVCEFRIFPRKKICYLVLMSGEIFADWHWAINAIEDWAKANGADSIEALTRKGFAKLMRPYGYREPYTIIRKDLTDRRLH